MSEMPELLCTAIDKRFSCRLFDADRIVPADAVDKLILAASKAPSGKNGQPWRFRVLSEGNIKSIAELLTQNKWLSKVKQCIAVFLDSEKIYDMQKDTMAVGACVENMILEAAANDIQSCWIGECNNFQDEINRILDIGNRYILMAIVAIGNGRRIGLQPPKLAIQELMI